jgi:P-type Mg2+ transporter
MMLVTGFVMLATLLFPITPLARLMEFVPLPLDLFLVIVGIVFFYFISAELTKRRFYANEKLGIKASR